MKAILFWSALFLIVLTGCTGGYQRQSYAISQNDKPIVQEPVAERIQLYR